ncbi:MerR family transcriptional regulator [Euzebya tangerina]|uniref:MerR family transcriptional regulator n=1 Tax=Euzebya tangerina TaxID=591198 RepID=UPI000E311DB6|nr:MerR family transcriptional regulator [Euzebya tangerina]
MTTAYRVEELAAAADVSVDTIRYYQSLDLLEPPRREGRAAWYDEGHASTLGRIRYLKEQGFTLAMIGRVLAGELDAGETALAAAIVAPPADVPAEMPAQMTLAELGERTEVAPSVMQAVARQGILIAPDQDGTTYAPSDAEAVLAGKALLDTGVPISELLALAREHDAAIGGIADQAVDLFARFVRDPLRAQYDEEEAATRMVEALQTMLPAATEIIAHTFRRRLLEAARHRIEADQSAEAAQGPSS